MTDFRKVLRLAAFGRIIKGVFGAFLRAIGTVLNSLKLTFEIWYSRIKYDLSVTPQVWSLERMLNDEYDRVSRRIRIEERQAHKGWFFFAPPTPNIRGSTSMAEPTSLPILVIVSILVLWWYCPQIYWLMIECEH